MGGIAHRFGWNSTLLRVVFVIVSIASAAFPGILVYLILWLLMPATRRIDPSIGGSALLNLARALGSMHGPCRIR